MTSLRNLGDKFAAAVTAIGAVPDVFYTREQIEITAKFASDGELDYRVELSGEYGEGLTPELALIQATNRALGEAAMRRRAPKAKQTHVKS